MLESSVENPQQRLTKGDSSTHQSTTMQRRPLHMRERPPAIAPRAVFAWTRQALHIRHEIAKLAEVAEDEIHADTSIFELGLDSIDAIKLSSRLRRIGITLTVGAIMRSGVIQDMVQFLLSNDSTGKISRADVDLQDTSQRLRKHLNDTGYDLTEVEEVLPTTPLQEAMVAEMIRSGYRRYYNHDVLRLESGVDLDRLLRAWKTVLDNSPILRTSFVEVGDPNIVTTYAQLVRRTGVAEFMTSDMPTSYSVGQVMEVSSTRARDRLKNMLESGYGPLSLSVVRQGANTFVVFSIAHALYDGHSVARLHHDVHMAYEGRFLARPSYLPVLGRILVASSPDAAAYWRDSLSNVKPCLFPRRIDGTTGPLHRLEQTLSNHAGVLQAFCMVKHVTMQSLGQLAWVVVLAHLLKTFEVVFGSVLSGRESEEDNDVLFPMMNTVAIPVVLHGSGLDMLRYLQDIMATITEHQHFPLRKALSLSKADGNRVFDSLFIFQKRPKMEEPRLLYTSIAETSEVEASHPRSWRTSC